MVAPPAELMEELVEEVLLRFPPDDPASLVRASLVCKLWHGIVSTTTFRHRFCEFHRTAPMLGILCQAQDDSDDEEDWLPTWCFFSTSSFRPTRADHYGCRVVDARHGRILLYRLPSGRGPWRIDLCVWDPITDEQQELPSLPTHVHGEWNAAVVCAAGSSCDHLDCHHGSFHVVAVFMGIMAQRMLTLIYASDTKLWNEVASTESRYLYHCFKIGPGVLLANTLYFLAGNSVGIVKYDMVKREISTFNLMGKFCHQDNVLMTTEDGRLGLATFNGRRTTCKLIHLWSMEVGSDSDRDVARFVLSRVIDLEKLLPVSAHKNLNHVSGFADGARVLFMSTSKGLYSIDIKSEHARKVPNCYAYQVVVPYSSFHTPALVGATSTGDGPRASSLNA